MAETVSASEAAARLEPRDTLGIMLGPGQPPALLEALGKRDDWEELRVYGALLLVGTELFNHPNVHYLSGFFGPIERALRDRGANISFAPADFRRFAPLLREQAPRVMATAAAPLAIADPPPGPAERAIAEHARTFISAGDTLQTGIGAVPSTIAGLLAEGEGGRYGIHSEMFTTGLMLLHEAGKIANEKGLFDGVSVATFAGGSEQLYEWLHGNQDVAFLPVEVVNSPDVIARNRGMVTINGAMAIDIHGQVVADTIDGEQYSGIGGHEDFVAGPALSLEQRALLCLPSTVTVDGELRSRIVPWFGAGAVITTPRHQVDVIVTEYGAAELQGKTIHQRGAALSAIAHPDFREELLEAAERASGGRAPFGPMSEADA